MEERYTQTTHQQVCFVILIVFIMKILLTYKPVAVISVCVFVQFHVAALEAFI